MCLPTNNVICFALEQMQCDFAINKMSFTLNAPEIAMTWDKAQRKMSESSILATAMPRDVIFLLSFGGPLHDYF